MHTTEVVIIPMIPGSNIGDPEHKSSTILRDTFKTLTQQDGMQKIHFGTFVEDPDMLQMMVDWDNIDKHKDFMAKEIYKPFVNNVLAIRSSDLKMCHVDFRSPEALASALAAPVTEIFTIYYNGEVPSRCVDNLAEFCKRAKAGAEGLTDCTFGTTHEEVTYKDVKGKAIVGLLGWPSVAKHMKFRETQAFKDARPLLLDDMKDIEMHHVAMMNFVP